MITAIVPSLVVSPISSMKSPSLYVFEFGTSPHGLSADLHTSNSSLPENEKFPFPKGALKRKITATKNAVFLSFLLSVLVCLHYLASIAGQIIKKTFLIFAISSITFSAYAYQAGVYTVSNINGFTNTFSDPDPFVACNGSPYLSSWYTSNSSWFPAVKSITVTGDGSTFNCKFTFVNAAYVPVTFTDYAVGIMSFVAAPVVPVCVAPDTLVNNVCVTPAPAPAPAPVVAVSSVVSADAVYIGSAVSGVSSSLAGVISGLSAVASSVTVSVPIVQSAFSSGLDTGALLVGVMLIGWGFAAVSKALI